VCVPFPAAKILRSIADIIGRGEKHRKKEDTMRLKLPAHFARWVMISIASFLVGFIIAQLLIPSAPGTPSAQKRLMGGSPTQALAEPLIEKKSTPLLPILVAGVLLAGVVAYGYFREKRKRLS
jgi:hypothetical protein